jgi:hypothetical protein
MDYFSTVYGLTGEADPESENGQLFLSEYILLEHQSRGFSDECKKASEIMEQQLQNCLIKKGLYCRNTDLKYSRVLSHDNMCGIISYSALFKTQHRYDIWKYLLLHLGTYDSSQGKSPQLSKYLPFNPANFFIWGLCADSIFCYVFFPLFIVNLLVTISKKKEDTSGKILSWVQMYPIKNNLLVKISFYLFEMRMKNQYGDNYIKELMHIYHKVNSENFPINKIIGAA